MALTPQRHGQTDPHHASGEGIGRLRRASPRLVALRHPVLRSRARLLREGVIGDGPDLWGAFGDSVLEVEDRGSIAIAFAPDGTVRTPEAKVPHSAENVHITFKEVPMRA